MGVTVEGLDETELDGQGPTITPILPPQSTMVPFGALSSRAPRFCTTDAWTVEKMLSKNMLSRFIVRSGFGSLEYTGDQIPICVKDPVALSTIRAGPAGLVSCL